MSRKIRRPQSNVVSHKPQGQVVRQILIGEGLPSLEELEEELEGYMDVLLGRVPPPIDAGHLTLMEVADAYFARASEIQYQILQAERKGGVFKGHSYYKFRTGELRSFLEIAKRASDLGSRRLTQAKMVYEMQHDSEGLDFFDD